MKSFMEIGPHVFPKYGIQTDRRGSFIYRFSLYWQCNSKSTFKTDMS